MKAGLATLTPPCLTRVRLPPLHVTSPPQSDTPNLLLQTTVNAPISVSPATLTAHDAASGPLTFQVSLSQQPASDVQMQLTIGARFRGREPGWGRSGAAYVRTAVSARCWHACLPSVAQWLPTSMPASVRPLLWGADSSRASLRPASLTFTLGDWWEPQTVTLTGEAGGQA